MAGFASPGVLFAGNSYGPERRFYRPVLEGLRKKGYRRFVEPCAGSFAVSVIAADVGWAPASIEASDVSLFSGVLGHYLAGKPLADLGVTVDDEPLALPDDPAQAAAEILWTQLWLRMQAKPDVDYWRQIVQHLERDAAETKRALVKQIEGVGKRLRGVSYESLDLFEHIARVADDPKAVIVAAPPTYTAGFEKFYDTRGRLKWAEPEYGMFDPATDCDRLFREYADARALFLLYQEADVGTGAAQGAVFARPGVKGRNAYVRANRPDEVFGITGGPLIAPGYAPDLQKAKWPVLPADHPITRTSKIQVLSVNAAVAEYYRRSWMHRLAEGTQGSNLLVLIDGYVAGAMAFSNQNISYFGNSQRMLLAYCLGPKHEYRLTRLLLMIAMQKSTALAAAPPKAHVYVEGSTGLMTTNFTPYPESKQMRGLWKLVNRKTGIDGFQLIYECDWAAPASMEQIVEKWLIAEERRKEQARG